MTLPYLRISPASVQTPDSTWYWDCTGEHRTSRSQQLLQQRLFLALSIATLGSAWVGPIGTCHRTTLVKAISQWESRKKRHQFLFAVKIPPNKNCEPQWKKTGVVRYLQCIYNTHFGGLHIAFWCLVINPPNLGGLTWIDRNEEGSGHPTRIVCLVDWSLCFKGAEITPQNIQNNCALNGPEIGPRVPMDVLNNLEENWRLSGVNSLLRCLPEHPDVTAAV